MTDLHTDAVAVFNETGLTPSQLLARVRELEAMVTPRPIELAPMSTALEVHTLLLWVDRFGWQKGNVVDLGDGDLLFNINNFSGDGWSARFFLPEPPPPKDSP